MESHTLLRMQSMQQTVYTLGKRSRIHATGFKAETTVIIQENIRVFNSKYYLSYVTDMNYTRTSPSLGYGRL